MLDFCDEEIVESLRFHLRDLSVSFRFSEEVQRVEVGERGTVTTLASGKRIAAETVMYSAGRQGATDQLALDKAGLSADNRSRIDVDGRPVRSGNVSLSKAGTRADRRRLLRDAEASRARARP